MRKAKILYRLAKSYILYKVGKPRIAELVFYITTRCNLRCVFCDRWRNIPRREITTEEAIKILDMFIDEGIVYVNFSGGEPLLRNDLEELAKRTYENGIINSLNTNGTLITYERAKKLAKVFDYVSVSLDGFEKIHDMTRNVPGTFKKALRGIKYLKEAGVKVGIDATVYKANWEELPKLMKEIRKIANYISFQPVGGSFGNFPYPPPKSLSLSIDEVERFIEELTKIKKNEPSYVIDPFWFIEGLKDYFGGNLTKICDAGKLYVAVNWRGDLQLCPLMDHTIVGNLLEEDLNTLLEKMNKKDAWRKVRECKGCWSQCTTIVSRFYRQSFFDTLRDITPNIRSFFH